MKEYILTIIPFLIPLVIVVIVGGINLFIPAIAFLFLVSIVYLLITYL